MWTGSRRSGFTLPEVLVALAVFSILVAVLLPRVGGALRSREAADAPKRVAALIRTASSLAASQEVYVRVVHDPAGGRIYLTRSLSPSGPFEYLGPEYHVRLSPGIGVSPSGFTLLFDPRGILQSPSYPVSLSVGGRTLSVSRWGEVR
jgi:prepilin-type N-terminal cleavage/methylation domain-containing protein